MAEFLAGIGTFFTTSISWLGQVLNFISTHNSMVVLVLAMPICGFAVGLLSRLIRM